jgi:general secretion pathway protein A
MYTEFYRLTGLPFQLTPDARFFFASSVHNKAMAHLTYGLSQGEGFIIITGDVGAGKTTLVEYLLSELDGRKFLAAKITNTQLGADDLLRMVASVFGIVTEGLDKSTALRRIEAFLSETHRSGRRALLVVDECQNLDVKPLEELRMLSNLQIDGAVPLQCFLLGQPQFRQTLARPELDQLRQRVIASYHLGALSEEETRHYIEHRLLRVGWNDDPRLAPDFFSALHRQTGGIPRSINTLCSRLLLYGFLETRHDLTGRDVDEVARDQQQELRRVLSPSPASAPVAPRSHVANETEMVTNPCQDHSDLVRRVVLLETYVRSHDQTIRRLLKLASDYLGLRKP